MSEQESNEIDRCHHMSIVPNERGPIKIGHFAAGFGEPDGMLQMILDGVDGYIETNRYLTPEAAIALGEELILRAKKARALRKRWVRQRVEATIPLDRDMLDLEDRGAETLPSELPMPRQEAERKNLEGLKRLQKQ